MYNVDKTIIRTTASSEIGGSDDGRGGRRWRLGRAGICEGLMSMKV